MKFPKESLLLICKIPSLFKQNTGQFTIVMKLIDFFVLKSFLEAARKLTKDPGECLVIEDSV